MLLLPILIAAAATLRSPRLRQLLAWLFPLTVLVLLSQLGPAPWPRAMWATLGLLYALKASVLLNRAPTRPSLGLALYLSVWPGMDPEPLLQPRRPVENWHHGFVGGWVRMVAGGATLVALAITHRSGWLGVAAMLLTVHLGYATVLTCALRGLGYKVGPLFDAPWRARSLNEFWTKRWNLAFVSLNRLLFMPTLRRTAGIPGAVVGAFFISGVLHEAALSYPAAAGWGGPLAYFAIQAALIRKQGRVWTAAALFLPLPLLFHPAARALWIDAPIHQLGLLLGDHPARLFVTLAGLGHFLVLVASFQVPTRLRWADELPRLSSFNHKLMWTYGVFIVFNIASFGFLTLQLTPELLEGGRVARALATFIAVFWSMRITCDAFYFKQEDWPAGPEFVVGHCLLTTLFVFLATTYWLLALVPMMP
jgi:hypothetical protein